VVLLLSKEILLSYQPDYYNTSKVMEQINGTNAIELDLLNLSIKDTSNQMLINTATTSLSRWEKVLGLDNANNYNTDYRRTRILSKLKGQGTFTISFLKNIASSFENSDVEVIEDNSNYCFKVKFINMKGVPPNLDDLKAIIEELKPAHLGVNYIFTFLTWDEHDNYNKTWNMWNNLNLTWSAFESYKE